jgi:hypothetical protein
LSPSASNGNNGSRDRTFIRILLIFGTIILLFGLAAVVLTVWGHPSDKVIFRMVGAMGSMFTGLLGLTIGYLTGRR